jgi:hypothetical protein
MAKIIFSVKDGVATIQESAVKAFTDALTPRRYVELFMTPIADVINPITSVFADIFLPSIVGIWSADFEDAAKVNYILLNDKITPCVIFKNRANCLVFLVKRVYGKTAFAEKVNVEDGDMLFTTLEDIKLHVADVKAFNEKAGADQTPKAETNKTTDGPSKEEKINALVKEKMQCLTRIRQINKEIKALE